MTFGTPPPTFFLPPPPSFLPILLPPLTLTASGLIQLVDDLQACLEVLRKIAESTEMSNPVKVAYAIKQMAKEAAVGKGIILSSCW